VTLEESRQRGECFILCSALGTVIYIFTADRCGLQDKSALPSFRKGCASITLYGEYSTLETATLAFLAWDLGGIYLPMERIIESLVGTKRTLESRPGARDRQDQGTLIAPVHQGIRS
jgi:hypothetical protein